MVEKRSTHNPDFVLNNKNECSQFTVSQKMILQIRRLKIAMI